MSSEQVQVEARTLSGVHRGRGVEISALDRWGALTLREITHNYDGRVDVNLRTESGQTISWNLAPTDLVTLTGGGAG
jgi:hypothetical protein